MSDDKPKAIIFGASQSGVAAKRNLSDEYCFVAYIDNNPQKVGSSLEGLPIYSPSKLSELKFDKLVIASEFSEQIIQQLTEQHNLSHDTLLTLAAKDIKPFHFSDDEGKKDKAEILLGLISEHLHTAGLPFYVDAGTLLGIYRDDALIPWDDDLDFAVDASVSEQLSACLNSLLPELSLVSGYDWCLVSYKAERGYGAVPQGYVRGYKLQVADNPTVFPMIDFFLKYIDGEVMDYVLASRGIRMPSRYMAQRKEYYFKGKRIVIPEDTEGYLAQHYGDDWRIPKQSWNLSMLDNAEVFS